MNEIDEKIKKHLKELPMEVKLDLAWGVICSMWTEEEIEEFKRLVGKIKKE